MTHSSHALLASLAARQSKVDISKTIVITQAITEAYTHYLNEVVDTDLRGTPIHRRDTAPFNSSAFAGMVDFAAGFQAAQAKQREAA